MQYLSTSKNTAWNISKLTKHFLLVLVCLLIWFMPTLHGFWQKVDFRCYALLNQSLAHSRGWQLFWGYLNHPHETWLNIVVMVGINILAIVQLEPSKRPRALATVIYFWLFFQFVLLFTQRVLVTGLHLQRHSPSIIQHPWVVLSEALNSGNIKVFSHCCFPAGHVLVLVFWVKFTSLYCKPSLRKFLILVAVLLTLPRMFSGAHWLSDIIFTIFYSLLWFEIAVGTPLYAYALNLLENKLRFRENHEKCLY